MSDDETLLRVQAAADEIAQAAGGSVRRFQLENGGWVVSIEPTGDAQGDWAVSAEGPNEATALSNLIRNAKDEGFA